MLRANRVTPRPSRPPVGMRALLVLVGLPAAASAAPAPALSSRPEPRVIVSLDGQCVDVAVQGTGPVYERVERTAARDIQTWIVEEAASEVEIEIAFDGATVELAKGGARVRRGDQRWTYPNSTPTTQPGTPYRCPGRWLERSFDSG